MKKILCNLKFSAPQRGFTLIELLVVIGILGILAASLVATINPFEQLKKANDTTVKNTAVEYVDANIRYDTTHDALPWGDTAAAYACNTGSLPSAQNLDASNMSGCLQDLLKDGEIQNGFTSVSNILADITITGDSNSITACFLPTSSSQLRDPNAKYSVAGSAYDPATSTCLAQKGTTACYWCTQ